MAYEGTLQCVPGAVAGADLSTKQFYLVKAGASGFVLAGAGEVAAGVLQNKPSAAGQAATVAYSGVSKTVAGAAITAGALVMSDAAGKAITATATNHACGIAIEAASADGNIISVLVLPIGVI